jgi:hypothetical protein
LAIVISTVVGLALVDALNPFSIAALVYLLGTSQPIANALIFTGGTYLVYFFGGVLVMTGWQALVDRVSPLLPWWSLGVLELALGTGLALLGVVLWRQARSAGGFAPPPDLGWAAILVFAVSSTVADLTSALPYFGAINVIAVSEDFDQFASLATIAFYCLIYCLPLITLAAVRALFQARSDAIFVRVRAGVDWILARLLGPATLVAGVLLVVDGVRRLWILPL